MKLRTARKIVKAVGTVRASAYTDGQLNVALGRVARTKEQRRAEEFWDQLMDDLGVLGRAKVLAGSGAPGMAFDLLMRTPVEEWTYGTPEVEAACSK